MEDFCGDDCFWADLVARSVRPDETEEVEPLCVGAPGAGCVVRARERRRGDMAEQEGYSLKSARRTTGLAV